MAKILIIDDDEDVSEILASILDKDAHEVSSVGTGEEGLKRVAGEPFDLVLADIFLPSKSGLEVIQELHRDHPEIRIIAMTAFGVQDDIDLRSYAERYGAQGFLEKPFDHSKVLEVVRSVLE